MADCGQPSVYLSKRISCIKQREGETDELLPLSVTILRLGKMTYERWILSFWLMKTRKAVAGTTTITAPASRLSKKLVREGVMGLWKS